LDTGLTDLVFVVQKQDYSDLLLREDLPQELDVPAVVAFVLHCIGSPLRRRHLAW
jgi:hypothetical protein